MEIIVVLVIALLSGLYLVMYIMYHKLSLSVARLAHHLNKSENNVISQIESLLALYAEIRPTHGVPPTRGWAASPDFLRLLAGLVSESRPKTVAECGSGITTLVVASCLKRIGKGHLFSLEHDSSFAAKTRAMLELHGLGEWATVIDAPLQELSLPNWTGKWYSLSELPPDLLLDLFVVDGPPQSTGQMARYPALPALKYRMHSGAQILLDDADRADEKLMIAKWKREFPSISEVPTAAMEKGAICLRLN